jgi:alanine racemase
VHPALSLDVEVLRENARAWAAFAGVPLRGVIKSDGYGWGFATLVDALDDLVESFVVADAEEFDAVRALTARPIVTLADTPPERLDRLLEGGAIPNIASIAGLQAAAAWGRSRGRRARIRAGLRPALGWAGFGFEELSQLGPLLARPELAVELWTHLTGASPQAEQRALFARAETVLRAAGAEIVATDVESSLPLRSGPVSASFVRVGIGLFGARSQAEPAGVRCALRLEAPVVARVASCGQAVGYGTVRAPDDGYLEVVRCGYGDGFTRATGVRGILSVGMQYTVLWRGSLSADKSVVLLDSTNDLSEVANAAGTTPHELVVRLGLARRAACAAMRPGAHGEQR